MEDELEKLKPAGPGPEMERWNVEDLEAYVAAMKAEIAKVEAIIAGQGLGERGCRSAVWRQILIPSADIRRSAGIGF